MTSVPADQDVLSLALAAGFPVAASADDVTVDPKVVRMLPRSDQFSRVLPVQVAGDILSVVQDFVPSPAQYKALEQAAGMPVVLTVCPPAVLDALRTRATAVDGGAPVSIGTALAEAVALGSSDLHVAVGSPPVVRVNGALLPLPGWSPLSAAEVQEAAQWIGGDLDGFTGDLDRSITYQARRWRVSVYRQRSALALAMRLIPVQPPSGDSLGLPASVLHLADVGSGLILFCGPTGSGKSTSMAALVDRINRTRACHILTIEDPIEYVHSNRQAIVHQREVGEDTVDFATGLRSALRQDPDVILVGELRDLETMSTALAAAETGHLVLATVHASSAAGAITRIVANFPADQQDQVRQQLSSSLQGVAYQELLPSRTRGRVLAVEVLTCSPAVRNVIREDRIHELTSLLDTSGSESGMTSLDRSLALLHAAGHIDLVTAQSRVRDKSVFEQFHQKAGSTGDADSLDSLPSFDAARNLGRGMS